MKTQLRVDLRFVTLSVALGDLLNLRKYNNLKKSR